MNIMIGGIRRNTGQTGGVIDSGATARGAASRRGPVASGWQLQQDSRRPRWRRVRMAAGHVTVDGAARTDRDLDPSRRGELHERGSTRTPAALEKEVASTKRSAHSGEAGTVFLVPTEHVPEERGSGRTATARNPRAVSTRTFLRQVSGGTAGWRAMYRRPCGRMARRRVLAQRIADSEGST